MAKQGLFGRIKAEVAKVASKARSGVERFLSLASGRILKGGHVSGGG